MVASTERMETPELHCRFCGGLVEPLQDFKVARPRTEPGVAFQGCTCGQYLLDDAARLVIDDTLGMDHPARRWISAWIQIALSNREPMPVLDKGIVHLAVRESCAAQVNGARF